MYYLLLGILNFVNERQFLFYLTAVGHHFMLIHPLY